MLVPSFLAMPQRFSPLATRWIRDLKPLSFTVSSRAIMACFFSGSPFHSRGLPESLGGLEKLQARIRGTMQRARPRASQRNFPFKNKVGALSFWLISNNNENFHQSLQLIFIFS